MRKLSWKQQRARKGISEVPAFVLARQGWRKDVRQFVRHPELEVLEVGVEVQVDEGDLAWD